MADNFGKNAQSKMGWAMPRKFQSLYDYKMRCIKIQIRDFRDVLDRVYIYMAQE